MRRICSQSSSWSLVSSRYQLFYNDIEVGLLAYVVAGTAAVAGTTEPVREIGGAPVPCLWTAWLTSTAIRMTTTGRPSRAYWARIPPSKKWFKNEGASADALRGLAEVMEVGLPREYFDLLAYSNGGEGPLPPPFHTLCLDGAESAAEPAQVELFKGLYPGWFVFGGDGGGELYAT